MGGKAFGWENKAAAIIPLATGILQLQGGVPLDSTLRSVTDQAGTVSPLQLSTTQMAIGGVTNPVFLLNGTNAAGAARNWAIALNQNANGDFAISYSSANGTTALANEALVIKNTGSINIGGSFTNAARLHVRGDGSNPVGRFESSAGLNFFTVNNSGQTIWGSAGANEPYLVNYNGTSTESGSGQSLRLRQRANTGSSGNTLIQYWADGIFSGTTSGTAISHEFASSGFLGSGAGSANYRHMTHAYTINNAAAQTGTATGIFLNATETALNGMTHNLMDLQVGGISKFKVSNGGVTTITGILNGGSAVFTGSIEVGASGYIGMGSRSLIYSPSDGIFRLSNYAGTDFSRLQFGGTTNAFPAIKRNGAAIDFRLADDSGYCGIVSGGVNTSGEAFAIKIGAAYSSLWGAGGNLTSKGTGKFGDTNGYDFAVASAVLQADSTTKGFLPPRMTTAQRTAIAAPATGLMVYDTDLNLVYVWNSAAWLAL